MVYHYFPFLLITGCLASESIDLSPADMTTRPPLPPKVQVGSCMCCEEFFKKITSKDTVDTVLNAVETIDHVAQGVTAVVAVFSPQLAPVLSPIIEALEEVDNVLERLEKANNERKD